MTRSNARRGQAAVEMAVLMVVLVPLVLYTVFLQDLLAFRLDQQESIVTPPWDFSVFDYERDDARARADEIADANRKNFCDHSSAYNSYNLERDCSAAGVDHHKSIAAHACWGGGQNEGEIQCAMEQTGLQFPRDFSIQGFAANWSRGGIGWCTSQLGVANKFIAQGFLLAGNGGWGQAQVLRLQANRAPNANADGAAAGAVPRFSDPPTPCTGNGQLCFQRDFFAVLHDPWAVNEDTQGFDPNSGGATLNNHVGELISQNTTYVHPIYDRMAYYFARNSQVSDIAADFVLHAAGSNTTTFGAGAARPYLSATAGQDGLGDRVGTPTGLWNSDPSRPAAQTGVFASGWLDNRQQAFTTSGARVDSNVIY